MRSQARLQTLILATYNGRGNLRVYPRWNISNIPLRTVRAHENIGDSSIAKLARQVAAVAV